MKSQRGIDRIAAVFTQTRSVHRAALMPYVPLGYPTPVDSPALVEAAIVGGADLLELGLPFSDPLADGPTIQHATQTALAQGMTTARCLDLVRELRERGAKTPLVLMGYYNPILAYGEAAFCRACREVGVDGLIVPDLPPEEGGALAQLCAELGLARIYLLAPTSPAERVARIAAASRGFVYLVSVAGITGARAALPADLADFVQRVRAVTDKPLAVGFGISTPEQAGQVAAIADGVIVGSALVRRAEEDHGAAAVRRFVAALRRRMAR